MENIKQLIADNIVKYRKMAGLTQFELASKLNYSDKAVSKWERGDSLPDVVVLKEIATLFGISLDCLTCEQKEQPKFLKKIWFTINHKSVIISSISSLFVWLVATVVFVFGSMIFEIPKLWLSFVYAIPVNCIVLLAITKFWKNMWYNFIVVSVLILSIILSLYLTFDYHSVWLLFIIAIPLVALAFLWFVARHWTIKK